MSNQEKKIVVAITGASGSIYAYLLLKKLAFIKAQIKEVSLVMSNNAKDVWKHELGHEKYAEFEFKSYSKGDFFAPFASGSSKYTDMIICPCSMGTLGRIASGISDDLITRAADVMLKERRRLIMVTRETPLNLIHINNMKSVTEAGAIICPASPSFYSQPQNTEEIASTVVDRILDLCALNQQTYRWGK